MRATTSGLLLDTCAVIWRANGDPLSADALKAIHEASRDDTIFVSLVSVWEIGILSRRRAGSGPMLTFLPDAKTWFARLMASPGIRLAELTPEAAIDAYHLPGPFHGDPADRLIVSTAMKIGVPVLTRDAKIIAFSESGHVGALRC